MSIFRNGKKIWSGNPQKKVIEKDKQKEESEKTIELKQTQVCGVDVVPLKLCLLVNNNREFLLV